MCKLGAALIKGKYRSDLLIPAKVRQTADVMEFGLVGDKSRQRLTDGRVTALPSITGVRLHARRQRGAPGAAPASDQYSKLMNMILAGEMSREQVS